ncbi:hypothetical protein KR044_010495, partial [Drosophila immigrans]
ALIAMQTKPAKRRATFSLCHRVNKIFPVVAARIHYVEREERPCSSSSRLTAGGSIDVSANASPPSGVGISPQGSPQLQQRLGKHLSKSASELNGHDCHSNESPHISPKRAKSAASQQLAGSGAVGGSGGSVASGVGVLQKTHGFFNNLRHRWSRAKSKDRIGRKSPSDFLEESTDYAADYSSESSSVTQSPRHRATTIIGGSPLARDFRATAKMAQVIQRFGGSMEGRIDEQPENGNGHAAMVPSSASAQQQLDALQADELRRKREAQLRQFVFFQLRVHLKSGCDLVAMDKNGLSDPYVKFKVGGRLLHKSRTIHRDLNPVWDEVFIVPVEDPFQPIIVKVFDYDWGLQDDFMGSAKIDLTQLELGKAEDINLQLSDTNNGEPGLSMGEILINLTLWPRSQEDKEM